MTHAGGLKATSTHNASCNRLRVRTAPVPRTERNLDSDAVLILGQTVCPEEVLHYVLHLLATVFSRFPVFFYSICSIMAQPPIKMRIPSESAERITRATEKFSEYLHVLVNEPSVGLFRIREHIGRSVPLLVDRKVGRSPYS
jgi:hypothetical protein